MFVGLYILCCLLRLFVWMVILSLKVKQSYESSSCANVPQVKANSAFLPIVSWSKCAGYFRLWSCEFNSWCIGSSVLLKEVAFFSGEVLILTMVWLFSHQAEHPLENFANNPDIILSLWIHTWNFSRGFQVELLKTSVWVRKDTHITEAKFNHQ